MAAELKLILDSSPSQGSLDHGWLKASLYLGGNPYWFGEDTEGNPDSLDWTWVDLLYHLGKNWAALILEQGYPVALENVPHPGKLLQQAEYRWENMPETRVDAEERQVLQFLDRHNLATAMSGANVPMLLWLRAGNLLWIVNEEEEARRVDFFVLRQQLEAVGELLADVFASSTQPHVQAAISLWRQREQQLTEKYLSCSTGLDAERLAALRARVPLDHAARDAVVEQEPVYLAAARMTRHHLSIEQITNVIQRLQEAPSTGKQPFARLMKGADEILELLRCEPPFVQGYQLARWLRTQLQEQDSRAFDPEKLLMAEGVSVENFPLSSEHIDAIACWGTIDPLILINNEEGVPASNPNRRRTTLAHEICHLLVDRTRALPAAEVLGGEMDSESEKRANAFAAELLLPQAHAARVFRSEISLSATVEQLTRSHQVSRQLVAYQLHNAAGVQLSEEERVALRNYGVS